MNATIARLATQSLFGQRRGVLVLTLPVLLLLLAVAVRLLVGGGGAFEPVVVDFGLLVVLPIVALLVTTGVLGPEIDDGSIVYLLAKPVSRLVVAVSKLAVAVAVAVVLGAGSLLAAALVLDPSAPRRALAVAVGGAVAAAAYCAVFVLLSSLNRHGTIGGLLYVLGLESLLGALLPGLRYLSVGSWGQRVAEALDPGLELLDPPLSLSYALVASLVVVVGGALAAGNRLRSFQLRGDE